MKEVKKTLSKLNLESRPFFSMGKHISTSDPLQQKVRFCLGSKDVLNFRSKILLTQTGLDANFAANLNSKKLKILDRAFFSKSENIISSRSILPKIDRLPQSKDVLNLRPWFYKAL